MNCATPFLKFKTSFLVFAFITIMFNCKKHDKCLNGSISIVQEHSLNTIYPSDYIMAYPGSWWEYDNGKIDSCFEWIPQKTYSINKMNNCTYSYEDLQYLPRTSFGIVRGDYIVEGVNVDNNTQYIPWTDTSAKVGEVANWSITHHLYSVTTYTTYLDKMEKLNSLNINGTTYFDIIHCIINQERSEFKYGSVPNTIYDYYFAKNIGIIKKSRSRWPFTPFYSDTSILINHYIAPH